jgi:hypothetical protein
MRLPAAQRVVRALPWAALVVAVVVFYWVEASLRETPWLFTDELEWSQLSRAIAHTGHAARRGEAHSFESFYSYLIAPAWWIHSTASAYTAIKYLNSIVMCAAAVPVYLLARLLVARPTAVVVALLSIAIPSMSYATAIVPEALAYLWFSLGAFWAVRTLARPSVRTALPAVVVAALGAWVRAEFVALPAVLVLAAAIAWMAEQHEAGLLSRRRRRVILTAAGLAAAGYVFNLLVVEHVHSWTFGEYINRHTLTQAGLAAGSLAIGLGVGPLIGGIASLHLRERHADAAYRAFASYLASAIIVFVVYSAGKQTFLLRALHPLIEERNLFFLSPLLLLGTALVFEAERLEWWLLLATASVVVVCGWSGQFVVGQPYFEAPGLSVLTLLNREEYWDINDFHWLLIGAAAVLLALVALRRVRWAAPVAAALAACWLLTGEIYATISNDDYANNTFSKLLPPPRSWVDADTHGAHTTFLGQGISDPNLMWLIEFWNPGLDRVESLDGSAPGPGPAPEPGLETIDGALSHYTGDPYTLATRGVELDAPIVDERYGLTLYNTPTPWHLLYEEQNVFSDGWAASPIGYTYFREGGPGTLRITLSRTGYRGDTPSGRATIRVGTVRLDEDGVPEIGTQVAVRHAVVPNGGSVVVRVHVAATPVTVSVAMTTFTVPGDPRQLAAQPAFSFVSDT